MITDEQVLKALDAYYDIEHICGARESLIEGMRKALEAYEQSKPKPEPVAYKVCNPAGCVLVESRKSAEKLSSEYGNGTYQPLYTTPTREPLSEVEILKLALRDFYPLQFKDKSYGIALDKVTVVDFARAIEQAHGIEATNDQPQTIPTW